MQFNDNEGYHTQDGRFVRFAPIEIASLTNNKVATTDDPYNTDSLDSKISKMQDSLCKMVKDNNFDKKKINEYIKFLKDNQGSSSRKIPELEKTIEASVYYLKKSENQKKIDNNKSTKSDKNVNSNSNYPDNKYFKINMRIESNKFKISDLVN